MIFCFPPPFVQYCTTAARDVAKTMNDFKSHNYRNSPAFFPNPHDHKRINISPFLFYLPHRKSENNNNNQQPTPASSCTIKVVVEVDFVIIIVSIVAFPLFCFAFYLVNCQKAITTAAVVVMKYGRATIASCV